MIGYPCFKDDFEHFGGGSALVKKQLLIRVSMSPKYWRTLVRETMANLRIVASRAEQCFEKQVARDIGNILHLMTLMFRFKLCLWGLLSMLAMAFVLLQKWYAPVSFDLHPSGKVSIAGGELHGWWASEGTTSNLAVCSHFCNGSEVQSLLFEAVQGLSV